jgi:hypothetical protein
MQIPDKKLFHDMQEHPEKYSDEQIEAMMDELDQTPDEEAAWQKFSQKRMPTAASSSRRRLHVAASFIGILMLSGIVFAAIQWWSTSKSEVSHYSQVPDTRQPSSRLPVEEQKKDEPVIFDNVPFDSMLNELAGHYQIAVEFQREECRQLRLHFEWKRSESLDRVVERLNSFEAVNIIREPEKLIVR